MSQTPKRHTTGTPLVTGDRPPTGSHPNAKPPTGPQPRPGTGIYPRSGTGIHPRRVEKKSSGGGGAIVGIIVVLAVGLGAAYFFTRDTWEQDNKSFIIGLKRDAEAARSTSKKMAYQKYDSLIKHIGKHDLKDAELRLAYEDAKSNRSVLMDEISKQEQEEADAKASGRKVASKKTPEEMKAIEAVYAKYEDKSRLLLDAFTRTKSNIEIGTDAAKYQEDLREIKFQYDKWYESITNAEAGQPSARLMKVVLESYRTAGSWWTIQTEKKMPEALYAEIMRKNEWAKAESTLTKIKRCMTDKDIVEGKKCGPCDGTGKVKCVLCIGNGVCQFCKGKPTDQLKCCTGGVCDACKGRRENVCQICEGKGEFPGK